MNPRLASQRRNDQARVVRQNDVIGESAVMQCFARRIFGKRRRTFVKDGQVVEAGDPFEVQGRPGSQFRVLAQLTRI